MVSVLVARVVHEVHARLLVPEGEANGNSSGAWGKCAPGMS